METKAVAVRNGVEVIRVGNYVYKNHDCRHVLLDGQMWFCLGDVKSILHMTDLLPDALKPERVRYAVLDDWGKRWPAALVNLDGIDDLLDFTFEEIAKPFRAFLERVENLTRTEHEFFRANGIED